MERAAKLADKNGFDIEIPRILRLKAFVQHQLDNPEQASLLIRAALDEARKQRNRAEEKKIIGLVGRIGVKIK